MTSNRPVVAVVGRPNVGKSTLVNRIVGRREAIVEERPGVTRDRKDLEADWTGREFTVVDTGGWQSGGVALDKLVSAQAQRAIEEADAILFVVDVTVGPTGEDAAVARLLLRSGTPVVLVVNKVDNEAREAEIGSSRGSVLPSPGPSRRCTDGARAKCSTPWSWRSTVRVLLRLKRPGLQKGQKRQKGQKCPWTTPKGANRSRSPSSGGPTSASRPFSTAL